jgi:hypothetical protein
MHYRPRARAADLRAGDAGELQTECLLLFARGLSVLRGASGRRQTGHAESVHTHGPRGTRQTPAVWHQPHLELEDTAIRGEVEEALGILPEW